MARAKRKKSEKKTGKKSQRRHDPESLGSRVFKDGKYYYVDLRWLGLGRRQLRDPSAIGWPEAGEPTTCAATAAAYGKKYDAHYLAKRVEDEERTTGVYRSLRSALGPFVRARTRQAEGTGSAGNTAVRHLMEAVGEQTDPAAVTEKQITKLRDDLLDLGYKPSSVRTLLSQLRAFFDWLEITPNPVEAVELPKEEHSDKRAWDEEDRSRIFRAAEKLDAAEPLSFPRVRLVAFLFAVGVRIQEAAGAHGADVNANTKVARITAQISRKTNKAKATKSRKPRSVTVLHEWWDHHDSKRDGLLFPDEDGRPVPYRKLYDIVREILEAAELKKPGQAAHQFRHTYAFLYLDRGGSMENLSQSLGHGRIQTTQSYYYHFSTEHAAARGAVQIYGKGTRSVRRGPRKSRG